MHFIFPKNYNFKPKILGFIEYSTAIIDVIVGIIIFSIINLIFSSSTTKIFCFISIYFPFFLISILGLNKESFITVFKYLFKYFKSQKTYLYKK